MTEHLDPRASWIRQRIYELQKTGLSYAVASEQAEAEAVDKFNADNGENGNGTA